jgi:RimJ/RimL family protein N-acetyltransferase
MAPPSMRKPPRPERPVANSTGKPTASACSPSRSATPANWPASPDWRLGRRYWGQGIATEAARAALEFGFTDRRLDRIVSIHQLGNDASGRIMQKLGMQLDREITDSRRRRVRIYAINRADYRPAGPRHEPS